jgi:uncharacterized membrane protein YcaP (DUF421 family)
MDTFQHVLGLGSKPEELTFLNVAVRGIIIFIAAIIMVRVGSKRFLSKMTALDAILGFILGSMLARAVNGSAPFFPTIGGGFVLVFLHRIMSWLARVSDTFGTWVKGQEDCLIKDGKVLDKSMKSNNLSEKDLEEELRLNGKVKHPSEVKEAYIERSGKISVIPAKGSS